MRHGRDLQGRSDTVQATAFSGRVFSSGCDRNITIADGKRVTVAQGFKGGLTMRVFIICAIVITAAVGVTGCFHHQKAVTQEPLKLG